MTNTYKSSSTEQQEAEKEILQNFKQDNELIPYEPTFSEKFVVKIDGCYKQKKTNKLVFVEVYVHQGTLKSGHYRKVCTDILKLITADKLLGDEAEKYILFGCEEAKACFENNSWHQKAVDKFNIKLGVGKLSESTKQKLWAAQRRQKMVNA